MPPARHGAGRSVRRQADRDRGVRLQADRMEAGVTKVLAGLALLTSALAAPVAAHHSFSAEYDDKRPLKLKGKVTEMRWANPHAWIYIEVTGKDVIGPLLLTGGKTWHQVSGYWNGRS